MKPPLLLIDDGVGDPDTATWVEFYDTVEELCTYLEPWFIDEPHALLDATGARLGIVRREYGAYDPLDLEVLDQPARPDIVRKFVIKEILEFASGRGSVLAKLIPVDPQSAPLEELWDVYQKCAAWHKANPPPRRSLLGRLKSFFARGES